MCSHAKGKVARPGASSCWGGLWSYSRGSTAPSYGGRSAVTTRVYPDVMTLTVHLPGELAVALEAEAARRGQSADQVAADLLAAQLPLPGARRRLAFAAVGASTSGRNAANADDMLAEGFGPLSTSATSTWSGPAMPAHFELLP
jgi:hypothetical protein